MLEQKSSLFLVKFQTKEGAGNGSWKYVYESRCFCGIADCIWQELKITNVCYGKWATIQHKGICLIYTSIIKDMIAKARSPGIKCVFARHKLPWHFFDKMEVAPVCCYERIWKFSQEIWAAKVHTSGENWLAYFFLWFPGWNEKFAKIGAGLLSHLTASPLNFMRLLVLQGVPACRLASWTVGFHLEF